MDRVNHGELRAALITAILAAGAVYAFRGFTVDDAWIPARYATNLASGFGYRFNPQGDVTDGVTPLPFAPLLALLATPGDIVATWKASRFAGALSWLCAAGLLGAKAWRSGLRWQRYVPLLVVWLSVPLAAWSVAGLETAFVVLLATIAVTAEDTLVGTAAAGLTAAFRPEMAVFAAVIGFGRSFERPRGQRALPVLLALMPWAAVYGVRVAFFGRGAPLSLSAKPADARHGVGYVVVGLMLAGAPVFAWAPARLAFDDPLFRHRWLVIAAVGHAFAVLLAGGDWMPFSRLLLPIFPALIVVGCAVAERASTVATLGRAAIAVAALGYAATRPAADDARGIVATRDALITQGRSVFAGRKAIATVDVGWVGAATPGTIVDLAGLTDPVIAQLPGGHTSKRVPAALLDVHEVDTLVFLRRRGATTVDEDGGPYERSVEVRLAEEEWVRQTFERTKTIASGPLEYVVFTRKPGTSGGSNVRGRTRGP